MNDGLSMMMRGLVECSGVLNNLNRWSYCEEGISLELIKLDGRVFRLVYFRHWADNIACNIEKNEVD